MGVPPSASPLNLLTGVASWLCFFLSFSECVQGLLDTFGCATYLQSLGQLITFHPKCIYHGAVVTICLCHKFIFLVETFQKIENLTTRRVRRQVCSNRDELGLLPCDLPAELKESIRGFVEYYSYQRYHQWLGDVTPCDVYTGSYLEIIQSRKEAKK